AALSLTTKNCGQFNALTAKEFYDRDPLAAAPVDGEPTPAPGDGTPAPAGPTVQGLPVADFFLATCAACHGQNREGLLGPALTPSVLTQSADFYFTTVAEGRAGTAMPSWRAAGLTDDEMHALVEYIMTVEP
ncbi:MAG: cytochrome c, partial [Dehalococcoidia bacterium]|nr:cytochrome c [Dehalococcoidia bacterium]